MKDTKKETKLVPKLRFKEFEGEWVKTKLQETVSINKKNGELPQSFVYIDLESVSKGRLLIEKRINKDTAPSRAQRNVNKEDILFQTVRPYQKNNYYFYKNGDYIASTGYAVLSTKKENNSKFIYQIIHTEKFVTDVLKRCTGTSYPAINTDDLKTIHIAKPSLPEQQKIASFLTAVDKRIEQLTIKKKLLEEHKKGVMQKIFNQEIRFKDENGNDFPKWEEIKIGEILKERNQYEVKDNGIEHVSLTKEGVVPKTDQYNRDFLVRTEDKKYKVTYKNDICYNPANLKFGVICRNTYGDGIFSPIYVTFEVTNSDPEFVEFLVTSDIFINKARRFEEGTVYERQAVKPSDFIKTSTKIPTLAEQKNIVKFISKLDSSINKTYIMLEHSQRFKKSLLQQMFI